MMDLETTILDGQNFVKLRTVVPERDLLDWKYLDLRFNTTNKN